MSAETYAPVAEYQTDHDILIELRTEMRLLRGEIKSSGDGTKDILGDHETRLRALELGHSQYFSRQSIGGGGVATVAATIIVAILHVLHIL